MFIKGIKMEKTTKRVLKTAFAAYCVLMLWLLFGQRMGWDTSGSYFEQLEQSINLIPFRTIRIFTNTLAFSENPYQIRHSVINLAGNIVMFVPLGFFIPAISQKLHAFYKTVLCAFFSIVLVEVLQLFLLLGSCDIDDLLLNMVGVIIGYGIYCIFRKFTGGKCS